MAQTDAVKKKKKWKVKKRWIVLGVAVVVLAALIVPALVRGKQSSAMLRLSDTTPVSRTDLQSTISGTGTVESADATSVYSTLSYPVMAVHVEVGDVVAAGDLLAELDPENVENQISSQKVSLATAQASDSAQLKNAQDNYDSYKQALDEGLNSSLLSAQTQVESARTAYEQAKTSLERYERSLEEDENTQILSAKSSRSQARAALESAEQALEAAQKSRDAAATELAAASNALATAQERLKSLDTDSAEYAALSLEIETELSPTVTQAQEDYAAAQTTCGTLEGKLDAAEESYQLAKASYEAAQTSADDALEDYQDAVQTAKDAYERALTSLESTQQAVQGQLQSYSNAVQNVKASSSAAVTQESIDQLEQTLADTKITAPCAGTVTAVYAEVGGSGAGLLFVIEDLEHLVVETTVKAYDIGSLNVGQQVSIRSDATGDTEFSGTLSTIAPTAQKDANGATAATGSDALFDAEVTVDTKNTGLRVGLEAQLDYVLKEETDVLVVPYEAVYQNEDGQTCVLTVQELGGDQYMLHEVAVETGMDNDLDIAVTGEGIAAGVRVVHAPDSYRALVGQKLTAMSARMEALMGMMG